MYSQYHCTLDMWCTTISLVINNSLVEIFELVISNDNNNSPKESKCFQWWWHCQQIFSKHTSLSSARQIYHWPAHNSVNLELGYSLLLIPPIHKYVTVWKCQCSAFISDKQFTNEQTSNIQFPLCPNFLCEVYPSSLPNLARLRTEKFTCLWMIQKHVPIFLKSPYSLDDKIRTTVQLITYTVLQNCLSLFTISQFTIIYIQILSYVQLSLVVELWVFSFLPILSHIWCQCKISNFIHLLKLSICL